MTSFSTPVLAGIAPNQQPLDQIRLSGVTAPGRHGVFRHERTSGQQFVADVTMHVDNREAATRDLLTATVDYAKVAGAIHAVLVGEPANLIETVAERIAAVVLEFPEVHTVDVRVHKPEAPLPVPVAGVSVAIRRDRNRHRPVVRFDERPDEVADLLALPLSDPAPIAESLPVPVTLSPSPDPVMVESDQFDQVPDRPVEAVLGLGANMGDAKATLREVVADLAGLPGVEVLAVSPLARTSPVGGPGGQADYLNCVVVVSTTLSARGLLHAVSVIENRHGRVRAERWGPRTIDIDLITYGDRVGVSSDLDLPHPLAHERAFVLVPWAQLQPDAVLPGLGGGPVADLAATAPDLAGIRWLALDWLDDEATTPPPPPAESVTIAPLAPHEVTPGMVGIAPLGELATPDPVLPPEPDSSAGPVPMSGPGPMSGPVPMSEPLPMSEPVPDPEAEMLADPEPAVEHRPDLLAGLPSFDDILRPPGS